MDLLLFTIKVSKGKKVVFSIRKAKGGFKMYDYTTQTKATTFYYSTKGIYQAKVKLLEEVKTDLKELLELHQLLKFENVDKDKVKRLKDQIKKLETEIKMLEFLYKTAFNKQIGGLK